jgi:hypothetical protein
VIVVVVVVVHFERLYARAVPLMMPGARALRSTAREAATYSWLVANMREHCDAFLTAPGLNSLHFWTGIPPVSTVNITLWPILLDEMRQERVLAAAAPVGRLCVAWDTRRMQVLMSDPNTASQPLTAWLAREFEPRAAFGGWEFRTRRGSIPALVYQGRWLDDDIVLELPQLGHDMIARLAVVDLEAEHVLGDTAAGGDVVVIDEGGAAVRLDHGIDVSRPRRLVVRGAVVASSSPSSGRSSIGVRVWARDGRSLATVPVVSGVTGRPSRS